MSSSCQVGLTLKLFPDHAARGDIHKAAGQHGIHRCTRLGRADLLELWHWVAF